MAGLEERILEAARSLEQEVGYDAASVDAIAERAGVAKTAIYRRWPKKGALLYEAVLGRAGAHVDVPDTGDVRADLLTVLSANATGLRSASKRPLLAAVMAEALTDGRLAELLRTTFFGPRADAIVARIERAVARGELTARIDAEVVPALLTGSLQYLWIVRGSELDDTTLARLVDAIVAPHHSGSGFPDR
jgi:AcrR family transcriptional regulator